MTESMAKNYREYTITTAASRLVYFVLHHNKRSLIKITENIPHKKSTDLLFQKRVCRFLHFRVAGGIQSYPNLE